jgi:hypothetical protein
VEIVLGRELQSSREISLSSMAQFQSDREESSEDRRRKWSEEPMSDVDFDQDKAKLFLPEVLSTL